MNTYEIDKCAVFFKTKETFGELSNMAGGFPLEWEGRTVYSSEALYQAHKFLPDTTVMEGEFEAHPFEIVFAQKNAMVSKMKAKKYRHYVRPDWHDIKLDVMNYCVRLKYLQHRERIDEVLADTDGMLIVEKSRRDQIWGATNDYRGNLVGDNLLGCIWMLVRDEIPNVLLPKSMY